MDDHLTDAFERLRHTWHEAADLWDDGQYERMATEYMAPLLERTRQYLEALEALRQAMQTGGDS